MFANALKSFSSNISANYHEKSAAPISTCGPWKIYDAKKKKTNQPVSIFVFERKSLDGGGGGRGGGIKAAQEEVVERLKREAGMLARLRHPCILELVEPVEDTRSGGLQFVTEPVTGSLCTLLREKDDEERSGGGGGRYVQDDEGRRRRREVEIDELEIQKGLLQVGKALEFLHESANLIHGNLTPDAVMVNAKVSTDFRSPYHSPEPAAGCKLTAQQVRLEAIRPWLRRRLDESHDPTAIRSPTPYERPVTARLCGARPRTRPDALDLM